MLSIQQIKEVLTGLSSQTLNESPVTLIGSTDSEGFFGQKKQFLKCY